MVHFTIADLLKEGSIVEKDMCIRASDVPARRQPPADRLDRV